MEDLINKYYKKIEKILILYLIREKGRVLLFHTHKHTQNYILISKSKQTRIPPYERELCNTIIFDKIKIKQEKTFQLQIINRN